MDIEQLKVVVELLKSAGEGAFTVALLWVLKDYFVGVLVAGVVAFGVTRVLTFFGSLNEMASGIKGITGLDVTGYSSTERNHVLKVLAEAWQARPKKP